jgi:hypothetical protein
MSGYCLAGARGSTEKTTPKWSRLAYDGAMVRASIGAWLLIITGAACSGGSEPGPGSARPMSPTADAGVAPTPETIDASVAVEEPDAAVVAVVAPPADAAPPPDSAAPVVTSENRCTRDNQCVLDDVSCGRSCPGPREAINKRTYRKFVRECKRHNRERRRRGRGAPRSAPCKTYDLESIASWPTHAVCDRGACVTAGRVGNVDSVLDEPDSKLPKRPTVTEIKPGLTRINKLVSACREKHDKDGPQVIKLKLKIDPAGTISKVAPKPTGKLGTCISAALKSETFPKTQKGVILTYPFRL